MNNFTSWPGKLSWVLLNSSCSSSFDLFLSGFQTYLFMFFFLPLAVQFIFVPSWSNPIQSNLTQRFYFQEKMGGSSCGRLGMNAQTGLWRVFCSGFGGSIGGSRTQTGRRSMREPSFILLFSEVWHCFPMPDEDFSHFCHQLSSCVLQTQRWGRSAYDYALKPRHPDHMDIIKILAHHLNGQPIEAPGNLVDVAFVHISHILPFL